MANSKISQLAESSLGTGDYFVVSRSGSNYKILGTGIGAVGLEGYTDTTLLSGKFFIFDNDGIGYCPTLYSKNINSPYFTVGPSSPGSVDTPSQIQFAGSSESYGIIIKVNPDVILGTNLRTIYLPDTDGTFAVADEATDTLSHAGYRLNYNNYVYNSGDLALSASHNGKTIVSTNTTGIIYTVASGLATGYSCSIVQYGTGLVTITGAAGISVNSYGGLTSIAGRYGSAYVNWMQNNSYLLAGNLA